MKYGDVQPAVHVASAYPKVRAPHPAAAPAAPQYNGCRIASYERIAESPCRRICRVNLPAVAVSMTYSGAYMKVKSIETYDTRDVAVVRVRTDDGAEGWGQTAPHNADITVEVLHRQIAPHVLGADPLAVEQISERCIEASYKFTGSYICRALAGVDTALWDLRGRLEGKPVCRLLDGKTRALRAYASSLRRDISPEDEAARMLRLRDACGFTACKVRIGRRCGRDQDQWPGRTPALVAAMRKAMGDDFAILVDANSCYTPAKAVEVGRMLQDHRIVHFEEPCPWWELEWTAQVAAALEVPVAGGEQDFHLPTWRRIFDIHAVDIAQPDVCYAGGFTRALQIARMAAFAGVPVVPHSANLSMVTVFAVHLMACIPNAGAYVEFCIEPTKWVEGFLAAPLEVRAGMINVPQEPGWGVTVNPQWLARARRRISEA